MILCSIESIVTRLQADRFPVEDFSAVASDTAPVYVLALKLNEELLNLQNDAVGMMLHYLRGECSSLQAKQYAWITNPSSLSRMS